MTPVTLITPTVSLVDPAHVVEAVVAELFRANDISAMNPKKSTITMTTMTAQVIMPPPRRGCGAGRGGPDEIGGGAPGGGRYSAWGGWGAGC
ncbi:MAG TPA: hypothetical protein QGH10_16435 [Armatimonadota bacterium]|nr:hypothetical protein [Armatimonadota bacterium]